MSKQIYLMPLWAGCDDYLIKVLQVIQNRLGMSKDGWCWRSVEHYNRLPTDLRLEKKFSKFKTVLKKWLEENVKI